MSGLESNAKMLAHYKAWANTIVYGAVGGVPEEEALKPRLSHFKTMVNTLNHVYVIDRIFQAHLKGESHPYSSRNTPTHPPLSELRESVASLDRWYIDYYAALSEARLQERVEFRFVDGGEGAMTRIEILQHLVNHGTYHRGFVGDMLNQAGVVPPSSDLTVFLRDAWPTT